GPPGRAAGPAGYGAERRPHDRRPSPRGAPHPGAGPGLRRGHPVAGGGLCQDKAGATEAPWYTSEYTSATTTCAASKDALTTSIIRSCWKSSNETSTMAGWRG